MRGVLVAAVCLAVCAGAVTATMSASTHPGPGTVSGGDEEPSHGGEGAGCSRSAGSVNAPLPPRSDGVDACPDIKNPKTDVTIDILALQKGHAVNVLAFRADNDLRFKVHSGMALFNVKDDGAAVCAFDFALQNAPVDALRAAAAGTVGPRPEDATGGASLSEGAFGDATPKIQLLGHPLAAPVWPYDSSSMADDVDIAGTLRAGQYFLIEAGISGLDRTSLGADDHWAYHVTANATMTRVDLPPVALECGFSFDGLEDATAATPVAHVGGHKTINVAYASYVAFDDVFAQGKGSARLTMPGTAIDVQTGTCVHAAAWGRGQADLSLDSWVGPSATFWVLSGAWVPDFVTAHPPC